jgi:transposase
VGAWVGLRTRRYQSGEVDFDGHISRRGDRHLPGLLYEAATVILTRTTADNSLRTWGRLKLKVGFKRAAVAVARASRAATLPTASYTTSADTTQTMDTHRPPAETVDRTVVPERP